MSSAEEFATLAHEIAHETLHRTERRSSLSKRMRETEAEAVAVVICSGIGLETGTASQDYIQLFEGDSKLLIESLHQIQQAASQILEVIGAASKSLTVPPCWIEEFVPRCSQIRSGGRGGHNVPPDWSARS